MHWILLFLLIIFTGCKDDKLAGPEPILPESGTSLYFAVCTPTPESQFGSLSPDAGDVCNTDIAVYGETRTWQSNRFHPQAGTIREGYHLVLERIAIPGDTAWATITFEGLATQFSRSYVLLTGESTRIFEDAETGEISAVPDSGLSAAISISGVGVNLSTVPASGSYIRIGVDRSALCEFSIYLGQSNGLGIPGQPLNYQFLNSSGTVTRDIFLDFTGGASLTENVFQFGPYYGLAYFAAESGNCRDTVKLYARPPAGPLSVDTMVTVGAETIYNQFHVFSDGSQLWQWWLEQPSNDTAYCGTFHVQRFNGSPFLIRPLRDCAHEFTVAYDRLTDLVWVIQHSAPHDTAWGYDNNGQLDSLLVANTIPEDAALVNGRWISTASADQYTRHTIATPFAGGASSSYVDLPRELTFDLTGLVGVGLPGAAMYDEHSIFVFDDNGRWTSRYPAVIDTSIYPPEDQVVITGINVVQPDSAIVFAISFSIYTPSVILDSIAFRRLRP